MFRAYFYLRLHTMKVTAELIERFFNKQCTAEQAKYVAAYLKENTEELNKYLEINEWNIAQLNEVMPEELCNEVWKNIRTKQKRSALILLLKKSAVAAIITGIVCTGFYHFSYTGKDSPAKTVLQKTLTLAEPAHKIISNHSKKIMKIVLQDNSVVSLLPGAVIKYDEPFQTNKRDISLTGEALFSVAKDKTKPFTVFAGSLTTTALGTKFKITTGNNLNGSISVKLFSGKVVIRPINPRLKGWTNDIYLLPGQQMNYDAAKMFVNVDRIKNNAVVPKPAVKNPVEEIPPVAANELAFDGTALPDVIDKLSKFYSVKIKFNKAEIEAMNFTGTINKKDSLTNILQLIGQMNDLKIIKEDDNFIIEKLKKEQP